MFLLLVLVCCVIGRPTATPADGLMEFPINSIEIKGKELPREKRSDDYNDYNQGWQGNDDYDTGVDIEITIVDD